MFGYDSDSSDGAPEEVSLSSAKRQADDVKKKEIRNQIEKNTLVNKKKRSREELRQARRKATLPRDVLLALAKEEQEKKDSLGDQDEQEEEEDIEEDIFDDEDDYSDDSIDENVPAKKKLAISKLVDGIEVQIQSEASKQAKVNTNAQDFLRQHFYGDRIHRSSYDTKITKNGLFVRNN